MTVPGAVGLIRDLSAGLPADFWLGAGTVLDAVTARAVIDAGARFVVSPVFRRELIAACHERNVPAMPAGFSPTEILEAHDAGADVVKVFPATALGPQFIKDLRGGGIGGCGKSCAMKVVTFGELMLRLSPPGFERFLQSPVLAASFGGGEANVAVSPAHFGIESHF